MERVYNERVYNEGQNRPITAWGYFGYELLFAIPFVGLLCAFIMIFAAQNVNVKNFAKSQFCFVVILAIFVGVCFTAGVFQKLFS